MSRMEQIKNHAPEMTQNVMTLKYKLKYLNYLIKTTKDLGLKIMLEDEKHETLTKAINLTVRDL